MKPFPSALKEKRRYMAFKLVPAVGEVDAGKALSQAVMEFVGVEGFAASNFNVVEYKGGKGIARSTHTMLSKVVAALAFLTQAGGKPARCEVLGISGSVKKTGQKY